MNSSEVDAEITTELTRGERLIPVRDLRRDFGLTVRDVSEWERQGLLQTRQGKGRSRVITGSAWGHLHRLYEAKNLAHKVGGFGVFSWPPLAVAFETDKHGSTVRVTQILGPDPYETDDDFAYISVGGVETHSHSAEVVTAPTLEELAARVEKIARSRGADYFARVTSIFNAAKDRWTRFPAPTREARACVAVERAANGGGA